MKDRGRDDGIKVAPPSEPDGRFSRIRLAQELRTSLSEVDASLSLTFFAALHPTGLAHRGNSRKGAAISRADSQRGGLEPKALTSLSPAFSAAAQVLKGPIGTSRDELGDIMTS